MKKNVKFRVMKNLLVLLCGLAMLGFGCGSIQDGTRELYADDMASALNAIQSGNTFKLKPGEYRLERVVHLVGKENITIDGNGAALIMNSLDSDVIFLENCRNVRLVNFKATHVEPSGPLGCTGNVIHVENSTDVTIENCDLNGSGIVGIAAYNSDNLVARNNRIHENSEYGIIYQGPLLVLESNRFENNGNGNVIYFSYVPKGGTMNWPPEHKIRGDTQRDGLRMSRNTFN